MSRLLTAITRCLVLLFVVSLIESCGGGGGGGGKNNGTPVAEGSSTNPVQIGSPYDGQVGNTATSYYWIPATAGLNYTITVSGMTNDVDLYVFGTANSWSGTTLCYSWNLGTADDQCAATATGSALYIMVDAVSSGAFYTITVTPTLPAAPTGLVAVAGNTQVNLSWSPVTEATSYNLYYSTTSGAGKSGTKISGVTSPYVHTGRTNGTIYYYVVTSVNANGESAASGQVSATPTAPLTPPQTFNFDDGTLEGWSPTGTWGLTSTYTYSTSAYAVTDSPAGNYSNSSNTSLTSPVLDLTGAASRTLSFYHRYSIEYADCGYVEVSTNGGVDFVNVTPLVSCYTNSLSNFTNVTIDLSSYITSSVVIRFRLQTDFAAAYDGWYIDNIIIQ